VKNWKYPGDNLESIRRKTSCVTYEVHSCVDG
jgi:hypothetical protein